MAKQFFKDLPDTSTPLTASRLNGLLDGEEAMGNLVVDSIRSKNMFDKTNLIINAYVNGNENKIEHDANSTTAYIKCKPNTTYTISKIVSSPFHIGTTTNFPTINSSINQYMGNDNASSLTITTDNNAQYIVVWFYHTQYSSETYDDILNSLQCEKGSVATTYSPYQNLNGYNNYSTEEIRIGTWVNGKPLYRKVAIIDSIDSSGNSKQISVTTSNLKEFVNITGMVANNSGGYKPLNSLYISGSGIDAQYTFQIYAVNNLVIEAVYGNWWKTNFKKAYVILEYTKTTD